MNSYKNVSGHSGVKAYQIFPKSIAIEFQGGEVYLYDDKSPGLEKVEKMKELAKAGSGLSTFVSVFVRKNFAKKVR